MHCIPQNRTVVCFVSFSVQGAPFFYSIEEKRREKKKEKKKEEEMNKEDLNQSKRETNSLYY